MDPEEIYQEVLQEEQQKGSAPAVAEGRAKAARARAEAGSPHPKEPKWWPGSQPHFEGGGEAPAAEAEVEAAAEPEPEPEPEAAPAAEAPAAPAQPEQPAVTVAQAEADATPQTTAPPPDPGVEAPAAAAAASGTAPAAAAVAAPAGPVAVTQLPPEARPAGVRVGTAAGNRLRPEDGVSTEAQFEGQAAMYERRKLIDELVATGVPVAAARRDDDSGSPLLAFLYLVIPIVALVVLANLNIAGGEETGGEETGGGGGGGVSISAANVAFNTDTLELPAGEETTVAFTNEDTADHNVSIYEDDSAEAELFKGEIIGGGDSVDYAVGPLDAGSYYFQCDVHPSMNGSVEVS